MPSKARRIATTSIASQTSTSAPRASATSPDE